MKNVEKDALALFKEIMGQCRRERKAKTNLSSKALALKLGITENYLSALENARAFPSIQVFLKYLVTTGFDTSPMTTLEIKDKDELRTLPKSKSNLIQKIYMVNEEQVNYLTEQVKISELFNLKVKRKKN